MSYVCSYALFWFRVCQDSNRSQTESKVKLIFNETLNSPICTYSVPLCSIHVVQLILTFFLFSAYLLHRNITLKYKTVCPKSYSIAQGMYLDSNYWFIKYSRLQRSDEIIFPLQESHPFSCFGDTCPDFSIYLTDNINLILE